MREERYIPAKKVNLSIFFVAISYFMVIFNPLGWHMIIHVSPFYFLFILVGTYENKFYLNKRFNNCIIMMTGFIMYMIMSYLFISDQKGAFGKIIRHVYEFEVLFFFISYKFLKSDLKMLINAYIYSGYAIIVKMLIQRHYLLREPNRFSIVNFGKEMDPNFLAALLIFPIIICFYRCIKNNFGFKYIISCGILVLGLLFTGSRGGVLGAGMGCMILFIGEKKSKMSVIAGGVLAFLLGGVILVFLPSAIISRFDIRTFNDGSQSLRFNLWKACWNIFLSNPICGRGGNSMINLGVQYGARTNLMTHNSFLDILADYGIVGFILFYYNTIVLFIHSVIQRNIFILSVIIGTVATAFFISASDSAFWWQNILLCSILLKYGNKDSVL